MNKLITIFKGVSDPIRLRMVALLLQHDELCVCDVMAALQLPQSTTSRHLSYLRRCGWLTSRQEGLWRYYRLSSDMRAQHPDLLELLENRLNTSTSMSTPNALLQEFISSKSTC